MRWLINFLEAALIQLAFCMPGALWAHDLGLAQVTVTLGDGGALTLRSRLSATLDARLPVLPEACTATSSVKPAPDGQNQIIEMRVFCPDRISEGEILLPWSVDGVFLRYYGENQETDIRLIPAGPDGVYLSLVDLVGAHPALLDTIGLYLKLGAKHILVGIDHLALLLCLIMLARGWALLQLVTAFTIGHTITLCLAVLTPVQIPTQPVEVLIAVSVVWLAREAWLGRELDRDSTKLLVGVGLLHGLGFASLLNEIGLPNLQMLTALFSFNIGVEIGQLIFLSSMIVIRGCVFNVISGPTQVNVRSFTVFFVGVFSAYWVMERLAEFYA